MVSDVSANNEICGRSTGSVRLDVSSLHNRLSQFGFFLRGKERNQTVTITLERRTAAATELFQTGVNRG